MSKFIIFDCEATDTVKHGDGNAHPETSLVYDMGWIVADNDGVIYETASLIIAETFYNSALMNSAFYAEKLPQYREGIASGEWKIVSMLDAWHKISDTIKRHDVRKVWAYNCRYDDIATKNTMRTYSNGFRPFFLPYRVKWCDIWDYAGSTIGNTKKYVKWAFQNGFVTPTGNPSTSADTMAKYVYGELAFSERHTALDDCRCELDILIAAKKRKQKARHSVGQGWRDASRVRKELGY